MNYHSLRFLKQFYIRQITIDERNDLFLSILGELFAQQNFPEILLNTNHKFH